MKQLFGVENNTAFYVGEYAGQAGVIIGSSAFTGGVTGGLMLAGNAATAIEGVQILVPVITTASAMNQSTTGNIVKEASGAKGTSGSKDEGSTEDKTKVEIPKNVQRKAKKLTPEAKKGYDKAIGGLKNGDTKGLNDHPLSGNRSGERAVDIKGGS